MYDSDFGELGLVVSGVIGSGLTLPPVFDWASETTAETVSSTTSTVASVSTTASTVSSNTLLGLPQTGDSILLISLIFFVGVLALLVMVTAFLRRRHNNRLLYTPIPYSSGNDMDDANDSER